MRISSLLHSSYYCTKLEGGFKNFLKMLNVTFSGVLKCSRSINLHEFNSGDVYLGPSICLTPEEHQRGSMMIC